jgi:hypothetical protein
MLKISRPRPHPSSKRRGCNPSIKKIKIKDMDGYREHQLAEVNTSAAGESESEDTK